MNNHAYFANPSKAFFGSLYEAGKNLIILGGEKNPSVIRDDFYETLSIVSLATLPVATTQMPKWPGVSVVDGTGATVAFVKLQLGKKPGQMAVFNKACSSLGYHITKTYTKKFSANKDCRIEKKDVIRTLKRINKTFGILDSFEKNNSKLRVLVLPAEASAGFSGAVYIHNINDDAVNGYTVVIPQAIAGKTKHQVLEMLAAEISVCISDAIVKGSPAKESSELATLWSKYAEAETIPNVKICGKSRKGAAQQTKHHLHLVKNLYQPITAYFLRDDPETLPAGIYQSVTESISKIVLA